MALDPEHIRKVNVKRKAAGRPTRYVDSDPKAIAEAVYNSSHPERLLELMGEGKLDCEIYAILGLKKDTFYRWRREYPAFESAFQLGLPRCEAWYVKKCRECWERGDDKGFKYFIGIMNNKFGWGKEERYSSVTQNTINIQGNMNVIQQKSQEELIELIQNNTEYLQLNNVLPKTIEGETVNGSNKEE